MAGVFFIGGIQKASGKRASEKVVLVGGFLRVNNFCLKRASIAPFLT
jgi:hypothetical protein